MKVTFTDDAGTEETVTSAATAAVAAEEPAEDPQPEEPQSQESPAQPTGLTGTVSQNAVSLTWDDPGDRSITGYQILRRDKDLHEIGEFLVHVEDTGSANTVYTDTDVAPGVRYVCRIKARNAGGPNERSEWFDADMPPEPTPDP